MTPPTKEKKTKRARSKYPALDKSLNIYSRKDYIEPDYINGLYNDDGKELIRPLTDEEKSWLNKFYEETVITNFYHHPELRRLLKRKKHIVEDRTIVKLKEELKEAKEAGDNRRTSDLQKIIRITKKQNEERYFDQISEIEVELQELREELLLYPEKEDHKRFYSHNNSRNSCLFNKSKITGMLDELEDAYYDDNTSSKDSEELLINNIERKRYEEEEERLKKVIQEEKDLRKKSKS